ncbi:MAG: hypothetical protein L0H63_15930 [Nitrococcus sp.]|nr:hypothetical protein [Nitrococcus sp.]
MDSRNSLHLVTRAPFHLEATVRVLQRRPTNRIDLWQHGRYLRVLGPPEDLVLVEVENRGTINAPDLHYTLRQGSPASATVARLSQTLRKVLGLDIDPRPLQQFTQVDQTLRPTALALRGMRRAREKVSGEIENMTYDQLLKWLRSHRYNDPVLQRLADKAAQQGELRFKADNSKP